MKKIFTLLVLAAHLANADETIVSKIPLDFTKCQLLQQAPQAYTYERSCIETFYKNHPFKSTNFQPWIDSMAKNINERLVPVTSEISQYLTLDGLLGGFPYEHVTGTTDSTLVANARAALNSLPQEIRRYIDDRFYGFMIVSGVGWTGYSPAINEIPGNPLKRGNVIIINADNIKNRTLNQWLEFRENTAFSFTTDPQLSKQYAIKMNFTHKGQPSTTTDNLKQFLIHESAHIVATALPFIHPNYDKYHNSEIPISEFQKDYGSGEVGFPFLQKTWLPQLVQHADGSEATYKLIRIVPFDLNQIFAVKNVRFYSTDDSKKFNLKEAVEIYKDLNHSCFASLYGTVNFAEDFAETVTHYFMTYKDDYEYSTKIVQKLPYGYSRVISEFRSPLWERQTCLSKLNYMKTLFEIE